MTTKHRSVLCVLLAAGWVAATPAFAQGILCPTPAAEGTSNSDFAGLFDPATGMTVNSRVAQAVGELRSRGLSPGTIVDHLVAAYCPAIAAQSGLSDSQKTDLVRRFALHVISYVYANVPSGETSVIVDVSLSPDLLDRVNDAAAASQMTRDAWISAALVKALGPK